MHSVHAIGERLETSLLWWQNPGPQIRSSLNRLLQEFPTPNQLHARALLSLCNLFLSWELLQWQREPWSEWKVTRRRLDNNHCQNRCSGTTTPTVKSDSLAHFWSERCPLTSSRFRNVDTPLFHGNCHSHRTEVIPPQRWLPAWRNSIPNRRKMPTNDDECGLEFDGFSKGSLASYIQTEQLCRSSPTLQNFCKVRPSALTSLSEDQEMHALSQRK